MSSAVSSNALVRRLVFFFLVISHLLQSAILESLSNCLQVRPQPRGGNLAQRYQFVRFDILPLALGEAVQKHCALSGTVGDQYPITAGPPCPGRATRCLITPPPRSASISPCPARATASLRLLSVIRSPRANRVNHLVLKIRKPPPHPNAVNYSTINHSSHVLLRYATINFVTHTLALSANRALKRLTGRGLKE